MNIKKHRWISRKIIYMEQSFQGKEVTKLRCKQKAAGLRTPDSSLPHQRRSLSVIVQYRTGRFWL